MINNGPGKKIITRISAAILIGWTILIALLFYWNIHNLQRTKILLAENDARNSWNKDVLVRLWSAQHGGVYVPITRKTPPNPYLDVPDRDVTIGGRPFTLVNPAYMTRQLYELAKNHLSIQGHITSLKPIRPQNKADAWETKALQSFERGNKEYKEVVLINNKPFVRLMRPFVTQKACLKCHAKQGYKIGDIRGGISISVPLANYQAQYENGLKTAWVAFGSIWIAGIFIIGLMDWIIQDKIGKLYRSERHASSILKNMDNAGFGLYIVDKDYTIRHTNDTMRKWFGGIPGQTCYQVMHNRNKQCNQCHLQEVIFQERTIQYSLQSDQCYYEIIDTPITLQDGSIAKMQIRTDVSKRKQAEIELLKAKEEAETATIAKSAFLANMSHDIRTPLNGIIGMLRLTLESRLSESQRKNLSAAKISADFLLGLLNDILDISKIDADQLILENRPFRLSSLIREVAEIFRHEICAHGLKFHVDIEQDLPERLVGDSLRLRQVLINLLGNAVKFTKQGSIGLTVDAVSRHENRITLRITVKDTGIGISDRQQKTIFDSFSQADTSTTRQYGGTGLGLAICKRLANLMGGSVEVTSTMGVGSTFIFTAQVKICDDKNREFSPAKDRASLKPASSLTLLLVEDNELNRDVARMTMENSGHTVYEAENGVEALTILSQKRVDAVLLDIQMPQMDGLTTARHIRACELGMIPANEQLTELLSRLRAKIQGTRTPIIALTAHAMHEDRQRCLQAGMDDYLTKPFQPDQLENTLALLTQSPKQKSGNETVT